MKKLLLTVTVALATAGAPLAQGSFTLTPSTATLAGTSGIFDITVGINTASTDLSSFDLFLGSNSAGASAFSITGNTPFVAASSSGAPSYPDAFAAPAGVSSGNYYTFQNYDPNDVGARSTDDLGFSYSLDQTISSGSILLTTLHFSYNFASLPASGTSYTFSTTPGTTTNYGSYFYNGANGGFARDNTGTGSFTVSTVPEPSTWSLVGLGGLAFVGVTVLRRRRTV